MSYEYVNTDMQTLLECCSIYAMEHDFLYNASKSVCMLFKQQMFLFTFLPELKLCDNVLPYVNQYKYLGVIFEQRGCSLDVKGQISVMVT